VALLRQYHEAMPSKREHGWESTCRFIEGEPLSGEDCAYFSRLAAQQGPQDIGFLSSMQAMEKSFIPTLYLNEGSDEEGDEADLASTQPSTAAADMLEQALETGLRFRACVDHNCPPDVARKLQNAMSQALVLDLVYGTSEPPVSSETRTSLSLGLQNCPSLQKVKACPGLLQLLKGCTVPEVVLHLTDKTPDSFEQDLKHGLSEGGMSSFTLKSRDMRLHCKVPFILQSVNAQVSPSRCLPSFKMEDLHASYTLRFCKDEANRQDLVQAMWALLHTRHLRDLTLPDPHWLMAIPAPELLKALYQNDLMYLTVTGNVQTIFNGRRICSDEDYADLDQRIKAILQLKRQRQHQAFGVAAVQFAHLLPPYMKPAFEKRFQETTIAPEEGSALASVNKATAKAASDAREKFDRAHEQEVHKLMGKAEAVPTSSSQSVPDRCSIQ